VGAEFSSARATPQALSISPKANATTIVIGIK
jgi:hypothetical protein